MKKIFKIPVRPNEWSGLVLGFGQYSESGSAMGGETKKSASLINLLICIINLIAW